RSTQHAARSTQHAARSTQRRWLRALGGTLALSSLWSLAGGCVWSVPVTPPAPIGDESFQSETALTTARVEVADGIFSDTAVMSFNDFTIEQLPGGPEFFYFDSNSIVEVRRGASLMGWARGVPVPGGGVVWTYNGKVHAAGWTIWADPSNATDRSTPSTVYLAQMAASDESFDTHSKGSDVIADLPELGKAINGFCVARSVNAAISFDVTCHQVLPKPPATSVFLDKTGIAVDWAGRVWVVTEDRDAPHPAPGAGTGTLRLYRNTTAAWNNFTEVTVPPQAIAGLGNLEPRLKSDGAGDIFLQSVFVPPGPLGSAPYELRTIQVAGPSEVFYGDVLNALPGTCAVSQMKQGMAHVNIGTGATTHLIKNAFRHDFAVGSNTNGTDSAYRFAFQYTDGAGNDRIQVAEIDSTFAACEQNPFLSTESLISLAPNPGRQFQPALDFNLRAEPPGPFGWTFAHLSTAFVTDPTDKYVAPWGVTISDRTVGTQSLPAFAFYWPLAPLVNGSINWYACPESNGYWGDYFGITQLHNPFIIDPFGGGAVGAWQNVAGFTDSRPASGRAGGPVPCYWETPVLGQPQSVSGSAWVSADLVQ
ncbi:MAG: hypothetical protein KJ015_41080, partial [Myxococcales bacterium]|nr:hypothetical protein [Myxococcales bacterium]